jgi:predicted O-methyltransferase YrrM
VLRNDRLTGAILDSLEPDERNGRWSQVKRFGRGMAVEFEIGQLLYAIVRALKPETVVETGTHKGFSTLMIAQALEENRAGYLYTIDQKDHGVAREIEEFGLSNRATFIHSDSVPALGKLGEKVRKIDLLWLDADHATDAVLAEIDAARPLLGPGSYVAFHDTLSDPNEDAAVRHLRGQYPGWEYIRFLSSRGFDLMRIP